MTKPALRHAVRDAIHALPGPRRRELEAALIDSVTRRHDLRRASVVLLYLAAFPEEIATRPLVDWVLDRGQELILPRVDRVDRVLRLHRVDDPATQLHPGSLGILEPGPNLPEVGPDLLEWVLVPGLAFDRDGFRLGRGGGFYDRLLSCLPSGISCWSIAFDSQIVNDLPREPHDQPVHGILTPTEVINGCRPR